MTFKKIALLLFFLGLIPLSCFEKVDPYYVISEMTLENYRDAKLLHPVNSTDSLTVDSVFICSRLNVGYISALQAPDFTSSAMASTKAKPGRQGLKDKIASWSFKSNGPFSGQLVGTDLKRFLKPFSTGKYIDPELFIEQLNDRAIMSPSANYNLVFKLTGRPIEQLTQTFTLQFIFESGRVLSSQTSLTWK